MGLISKLFDPQKKILKKARNRALAIDSLKDEMAALTDEQLKAKTTEFKERIKKFPEDQEREALDSVLNEAFAVCREAAKRVLKQFPYLVQIMGALVIHEGDVAEMKTGEGKTLTATMAVYLNALTGKGVHVVTVNEYLANRDAEWMGEIYRFLGLSVGVNLREKSSLLKKEAYDCDITYTTNSELGFDYLRDNMVRRIEDKTQRGLNFAVIDEADSILIDESRTPLIISGGNKANANLYVPANRFVRSLTQDEHFEVDLKSKSVYLKESGIARAERVFGLKNLYDIENSALVHCINQALKANYAMAKDVDYVVVDGEVVIVDQFTGRYLKGRTFSDGLHQAIEAKERVKINPETTILATITYQNLFRLYNKLAGMTGTAKTEEEEFLETYNMRVIEIPTNVPVIRIDDNDMIFAKKDAKFAALIEDVKQRHEKGQPVLVGTIAVETSEEIDKLMQKAGLHAEVLNAKNHEREAEIIAKAGQIGAITIATNMAGRGTDIKLGEGVRELGGLAVLGSERHESRRIDNQLRGRSGRQGDPGFSRFYVSLDDELMVRFASDNLRKSFANYGEEAIESRLLSSAITSAQKRIEGQNFDVRKNLLDYDDVLSKQRQIMYAKRDQIIFASDINDLLSETFKDCGVALCKRSVYDEQTNRTVSSKKLHDLSVPRFLEDNAINWDLYDEASPEEAGEDIGEVLANAYQIKRREWDKETADQIERQITLKCIDRNWTQQIDNMSRFRESVSLRSYGQINPLQDYVNEGWAMFRDMLETISLEVVLNLLNVKIQKKVDEKDTYAVNTQAQNDIHKEPAASTEEAKDMKVVTKETGKDLNITDIDKNAKAAVDHEYDDIHTN